MINQSKIRDFVIGIAYESIEEDRGHITLRRKVCIEELIQEVNAILNNGSNYPQFPPEANPTITYAWDLSSHDDGDCYHEIITKLEKNNRLEVMN